MGGDGVASRRGIGITSGCRLAGQLAARLLLFRDAHIEVHGRYLFAAHLHGGLRPMRDPAAPLDDDEEEQEDST